MIALKKNLDKNSSFFKSFFSQAANTARNFPSLERQIPTSFSPICFIIASWVFYEAKIKKYFLGKGQFLVWLLGQRDGDITTMNTSFSRRFSVFYIYKTLHPKSLLDFGCGPGVLAKHLPSSWDYWGIDLSPSMIENAKKPPLRAQKNLCYC